MLVDQATRIAKLWQAGKMIGGDEDEVCHTLIADLLREMDDQIEYSRGLGDDWIADFLTEYRDKLKLILDVKK